MLQVEETAGAKVLRQEWGSYARVREGPAQPEPGELGAAWRESWRAEKDQTMKTREVTISSVQNNDRDRQWSERKYVFKIFRRILSRIIFIDIFIWLHQVSAVAGRISFPDQGMNPGSLHLECRVLAPGPPGKPLTQNNFEGN